MALQMTQPHLSFLASVMALQQALLVLEPNASAAEAATPGVLQASLRGVDDFLADLSAVPPGQTLLALLTEQLAI